MVDVETRLALEADELVVREVVEEHGASLLMDEENPSVYWLTLSPRAIRSPARARLRALVKLCLCEASKMRMSYCSAIFVILALSHEDPHARLRNS